MKKIYYIIQPLIYLMSVATLSSCAVGKAYKSPDMDRAELVREYEMTDTVSMADIPWTEFFAGSILNNLISQGLQNNFDMQIAAERIVIAEANLRKAGSAFFPSVSLVEM